MELREVHVVKKKSINKHGATPTNDVLFLLINLTVCVNPVDIYDYKEYKSQNKSFCLKLIYPNPDHQCHHTTAFPEEPTTHNQTAALYCTQHTL